MHLSEKLQRVSEFNPTELLLENVILNYVHCMAHQDMDWNGLCYKLQQKAYDSMDQLFNIWVNTAPCLVHHTTGVVAYSVVGIGSVLVYL